MNTKRFSIATIGALRLSLFGGALALLGLTFAPLPAAADKASDEEYHKDFIYGAPAEPAEAWILSRGGRLYDNWYKSLDADKPKTTHPAWPASNTKKKGAVTWRCKSCHGWDGLGRDGQYAKGSYKTGIAGVQGAKGKSVKDIIAILTGSTHGYTYDMIPKDQMGFLAAFVSHAMDDNFNKYIDRKTGDVKGNPKKGVAVFQTICAACHGFDGTALDWGEPGKPKYIGTEANANPWEVLHKIRNGHPGVEMISLRAFSIKDAANVLAYTKLLPQK